MTYNSSTGQTTGIQLENGEWKAADLVVNADLVWAHNNLFTTSGGGSDGQTAAKIDGLNGDNLPNAESLEKSGDGLKAEELLDPKLAKKLLDKPHS